MTDADRIQPYAANPFYWQLKGAPVLLVGGSTEDNLFQIPDLEAQLDTLAAAGGNYVRCTLSSRDEGNVWPFERDPATGLYDLERPGAEYWGRFERFLDLTAARDVVVQVEVWDRFDFARAPWRANPFNPTNTATYTAEQTGLPPAIDTHPAKRENPFFRSVPALEDNAVLLAAQHRHVDRLLAATLPYGHVLYCMDNETNESPEWGRYWATTIREAARQAGRGVETTEMWDAHDVTADMHRATWAHPETYSFVDLSQNNHSPADRHWEAMAWLREQLRASGRPRPMNTVKIYGANPGRYGTARDARERFWRNLFGGVAATRFHRPPSGIGLSEVAQAHLRSERLFAEAFEVFTAEPAMDLLSNRSWNEAYAMAAPGRHYAVFFTDGGDVGLDVSAAGGRPLRVAWLDAARARWTARETRPGGAGKVRLVTPRPEGYWVAVVRCDG